ncbi:MAG: PAS domain S-box protein [Alphaproteobacteria bacterium]|nr:PAS domain S-box protein [Alphaproteobacteria bacterium]
MSWLDKLGSADGFMPHGYCYLWEPGVLWTHVVSDGVIGLSYFAIPLVLVTFSVRRGDLQLNAVFYAMSAFIVACGLTHFFSILVVWHPFYVEEGLVKAITAAISAAVATGLWLVLPRLVALPSPAKLATANAQLSEEVTLRREMEQQLGSRNAELTDTNRQLAMLDHALTHAAGAIAIASTDAVVTYCNDGFAQLLGEPDAASIIGRSVMDYVADHFTCSDEIYEILRIPRAARLSFSSLLKFIHPEDREPVQAAMERCLEAPGRPLSVEYRVVHPDGDTKRIHAQAETTFDESGRAVHMTGTLQDVTVHRAAEAATRRTETFLDLIVENIPAMLFVKDAADLRFVTLNRAGEALLGLARADIIGKNDYDLFPAEQADSFTAADQAVLEARQTKVIAEEVIDTREHGRRLLRTIKVPVFDEDDKPLYLLGFSTDITEQKQLEQQFLQAQKMETVGHLTGGVAHDFNNVLMAMQLNLEVVRDGTRLDTEAAEALDIALNAVQRGAELTGRLLAFSRQQPLQPSFVNVNKLVGEMMRLLHRALQEDLNVETVLAAGIWSIEIDPAQLENALINLAVNARDAMPSGGKLTIETANTRLDDDYVSQFDDVPPGQYVMIAVSDTGTGMTREVIERAFDPFFTTKEVGRGSGLGLSMVYGFVKQSGGHVKIYSELGHGTTVKLYFPRVMADDPTEQAVVLPPAEVGSEVILLVEDDPSVAASLQRSLAAFGYAVHTARTGAEALALIGQGLRPGLLLADVVLPGGMNGPETAAAVEARCPECRTLYMSGYTDNAIVHQGRLDPGVALISKPFSRRALAAKIREVLDAPAGDASRA